MRLFNKFYLFILIIFCCLQSLTAQRQSYLDVALRHLEQNRETWQLTQADMADVIVSNEYVTKHNGVTHFYFIQRHQAIEVYNAIAGVHIKADGQVGYVTNRFVANLADRINTTQAVLTPYDAVRRAASELSLAIEQPLQVIERHPLEMVFAGGSIARSDIRVKLFFLPVEKTGKVRLVWNMGIDQIDSPDYWSLRVDAVTGEILQKHNKTYYCSTPGHGTHRYERTAEVGIAGGDAGFMPVKEALLQSPNDDGAGYNVFAIPLENPLEGSRQLLVNPHDRIASPLGWHDTNGIPGAEYTITRGNNAHVFLDLNDTDESKGDETDGGEELNFDFPLDLRQEPAQYRDAANTQIFYMINVLHDFSYHYGFDEAAGNFQENNYGNGGEEGDYVEAHAQDGADLRDDDHTNNANFFTPPDGASGRMQIYLWNIAANNLLSVTAPTTIAGSYETSTANFGPAVSGEPIVGAIVNAVDNSNQPSLGCSSLVNTNELAGNIAMVDRGQCFFKQKTANAEKAGAIALIICNFEESVVPMGNTNEVPDVNIPTIMLKSSDCRLIRQFMVNDDVRVELALADASGPQFVDGGLDNGLIAHEYGHGIIQRLTGGPGRTDCTANNEAMDEGWSDFFSLVIAAKPEDRPNDPAGIGSYVWQRTASGVGFRRLPYSRDFAINDLTYDDVISQGTHRLGEVWAATLWDLYWSMVDLYGFDEDLYNGDGGNNRTIRLVMDGLKLQDCNPGFIDGRNAILAADALLYNGAHECLIWEVFARRGIGWDAIQGLSTNQNDNIEGFENRPECVKELKIKKLADQDLILPGEEIEYTLQIANHTDETAPGVIVSDVIPAGAAYIAGTASDLFPFTVDGELISWEVGDVPAGQTFELSYRITTDPSLASTRLYYDDMENSGDAWIQQNLQGTGIWDITFEAANSGERSWYVPDTREDNDQGLVTLEPLRVDGVQPVLRFYHKYETEPLEDGGIVQISVDGGSTWNFVDSELFKHTYRSKIDYGAFAIPDIGGFWGKQNEFTATYIDLTAYRGQQIMVRFRFGSDQEAENTTHPYDGWYVDDFELMDMVNYETEACISSTNGSSACDRPDQRGTVVESATDTPVSEIESLGAQVRVFPNPADEELQVTFEADRGGLVEIALLSINGQLLQRSQQQLGSGFSRFVLPVADLPAGFYLLRLSTNEEVITQKVIVE